MAKSGAFPRRMGTHIQIDAQYQRIAGIEAGHFLKQFLCRLHTREPSLTDTFEALWRAIISPRRLLSTSTFDASKPAARQVSRLLVGVADQPVDTRAHLDVSDCRGQPE